MYTMIQVVFDAAEPEKLAEFWGLALGYVSEPPPEGFESWEEFARSAGIAEEQFGDVASRIDPAGEAVLPARAGGQVPSLTTTSPHVRDSQTGRLTP
jgi:Glyoxalase-like domain